MRRRFSQSLILRDENLADSARFEGCEGSCGPWLREWFCSLPGGGLYDQGAKFNTVVIRSRSYGAFRFLEARFGGRLGSVEMLVKRNSYIAGLAPGRPAVGHMKRR